MKLLGDVSKQSVCAVLLAPILSLGATPSFGEADGVMTTNLTERRLADLAGSGLGLAGMRADRPAPADPLSPTDDELRQMALWTNYRGLIDITEGSGFEDRFEFLMPVPGVEVLAWRTLPGMTYPHAVAVLIPDSFDVSAPCIVVVAASAVRNLYGGAGIAGDWALQQGCGLYRQGRWGRLRRW